MRRTHTRSTNSTRRAFTLVELSMTVVIGGLVILGVFGVFAATNTMERVFGNHFQHSTELSITQRTIRRAMLSISVQQDPTTAQANASQEGVSSIEETERARLLLEPDPNLREDARGWHPQRFEIVLSEPPIALNTMSNAALWARLDEQDDDSRDFSSDDATGGIMRSVFELRPDGQREQVMSRLGILSAEEDAARSTNVSNADSNNTGWTLWWRPILSSESELLRAGYPIQDDNQGSVQEIGTRLAGAVRLARGIDSCLWRIFRSDEKISEYAGLNQRDIPAYIEFDILLLNGQFATWMFEIDWIISDDPLDIAEEEAAAAGNADDADDDSGSGGDAQPNQPDGIRGNPNRPGQGGPNNRPDRPIRVNLSEDDT